MEANVLLLAAEGIVLRNVTPNVVAAWVCWSQCSSHLKLTYQVEAPVAEGDLEWQELALAELIAEFPEVKTAECVSILQPLESELDVQVYGRGAV